MQIKIVSRWDSDRVLYECDVPDGIESGLAMGHALEKAVESRAYLTGANLTDANLSGAYLTRANLTDAYLSGAYLSDANLTDATWRGIKITRAPLQVSGLHWFVTILDGHMQIGCELHALTDWAAFDDARIVQMDGKDALRFWRANKAALMALAAAHAPAVEAEAA